MNQYTKHLNDFGLSPGQLEAKYAEKGEHPHFPRENWDHGYWMWVRRQLEREEDDGSDPDTRPWTPNEKAAGVFLLIIFAGLGWVFYGFATGAIS